MATDLTLERGATAPYAVSANWDIHGKRTYECRALVCPEDEGGYSAYALSLPGVASQGETVEEAFANLAEAFEGALGVYLEDSMPIPWETVDVGRRAGSIERWIVVNV